jgi:hypothetical protein
MMFTAFIIVVVGYRTAIDKDTCRYTACIWSLNRKEPKMVGIFALRRETTPLESLQLILFPISGIIAE